MCTLHTYCSKTGILHCKCFLLMLKGSMNNSAPLPFLLCCTPIELPEQSCINKFWLTLQLQFHAWPFLRYIQAKINNGKKENICTNHFVKSHVCAISPSHPSWVKTDCWKEFEVLWSGRRCCVTTLSTSVRVRVQKCNEVSEHCRWKL